MTEIFVFVVLIRVMLKFGDGVDVVDIVMKSLGLDSWIWVCDEERISHKKTENQSKSDKIGHEMEKCVETKPNQRADYANWETSFMKERKWEKENAKRKDVEGPFLYTNQTFP
ncbi:hypothetical protein Tco_0883289 [Tanacetum coccineum]